ncbi:MAG TPA: HD domain-containing phosphohydrolase [Candidatus Angelobacter sp.]|nr:HD domain-containing phosphohydrolase [Candidatus Angelobacter sp.]
MAGLPTRARMFLFLVWTGGAVCFAAGMFPWHSGNRWLFGSYLVLTALASAFKTVLPGLEGTVSANDVFFLVGVCSMTLSETLALALIPTAVQCFWRRQKRLGIIHFAFNLSQVALAITAAFLVYQLFLNRIFYGRAPLALLIAAIVYFLVNTLSVATMVALAEGTSIKTKWTTGYWWTFPYCLIGAAIAGVIQLVNRIAGWEMSILVLPAIYAIYRSYRMQLGRWEDEKVHLQEIASLHVRTIETLALAIEAKDHTTGDHLQRVRVYAAELARDLRLSAIESEALQAASVLHDIGKLAVPEHIISKPGKLTPEEFDKMKIHPIVGAEILEQVKFPYPVASVVRSHHEKWDGSGYPDGLAGEEIPIGARILSAVDCLDALASDRQYRRALPLDEAMAHVEKESGKAFDPKVVAALKARYVELEQLARSQEPQQRPTLSIDVKVNRGAAPDAGFAVASAPAGKPVLVNRAQNQDHGTPFIWHPGESVNLEEILSSAAVRLRHLVPYDAMAVFVNKSEMLIPHFVLGENARQLSSLRVPLGEGLIGWIAETGNSIVNGNPTVEPGFMERVQGPIVLRAALALPLEHQTRIVGVLALYRLEPDAFTSAHLEILEGSRHQLGAAIAEHLESEKEAAADSLPDVSHTLEPHLVGAGRTPRPF